MKKILLILPIMAIMFCSSISIFASDNKKAKKEEEKRLTAIQDSIDFAIACNALKKMEFVIGAERISFKDGTTVYTERNTNFISANDGKAVVQLAFPQNSGGFNGLGGITVQGSYSSIKPKVDKKGNFSLEFNVMGSGISARINVFLAKNSKRAYATVYPNFNSNTLSVSGDVIPYTKSRIFQGRTL